MNPPDSMKMIQKTRSPLKHGNVFSHSDVMVLVYQHTRALHQLHPQVWISVQRSTEAASSRILRKCSFALPSHGPHSHILSLPNYLNVKVLSCTGMPLDASLLELWGCAARRHRPKADTLSFLPRTGRPSGEVSAQPGEAGGIGRGTAGTKCDFSS